MKERKDNKIDKSKIRICPECNGTVHALDCLLVQQMFKQLIESGIAVEIKANEKQV